MKRDIKLIAITALAVAVVAAGLFWQLSSRDKSETNGGPLVRTRSTIAEVQAKRAAKRMAGKSASKAARENREKPRLLNLEDPEEAKLNEFSRAVLADLQQALDDENFELLKQLVAAMMKTPPDPRFGSEGVQGILRRKAVEALGWFGSQAIPELVGYIADQHEEVSEMAIEQFELALQDITLSDYERADIVALAAKAVSDTDFLEQIFMEIANMRNSVAAGLLVDICQNGTEQAQNLMPDTIEFVTGEDNIQTVEDLEKWLQENPDGPDDDDLYGGMESE